MPARCRRRRTIIIFAELHQRAYSRVGKTDTAFITDIWIRSRLLYRVWTDPADTERNIRWTRDIFAAWEPHLAPAAYVNDLGDEGEERVRSAYGENYARLVALKAKYDPTDFSASTRTSSRCRVVGITGGSPHRNELRSTRRRACHRLPSLPVCPFPLSLWAGVRCPVRSGIQLANVMSPIRPEPGGRNDYAAQGNCAARGTPGEAAGISSMIRCIARSSNTP